MTFKEKLAKEHPNRISEDTLGGCIGCPMDYGYEYNIGCPEVASDPQDGADTQCRKCWNREIPGGENEMTEKDACEQAYKNGYQDAMKDQCPALSARLSLYNRAYETWGPSAQSVVAVEELSEAAKEICKAIRGRADLDHLAEEIADAEIMLEQMRYIYGLNKQVSEWKRKKLMRLDERLTEAEHGE